MNLILSNFKSFVLRKHSEEIKGKTETKGNLGKFTYAPELICKIFQMINHGNG